MYYYQAENSKWTTKYEAIRSDVINLTIGVTNYFSLAAQGSIFTIYANGQKLATITDQTLESEGRIGFAVELYDKGQTMEIDFDNFLLEEVP